MENYLQYFLEITNNKILGIIGRINFQNQII